MTNILNIEIKARCTDPDRVRKALKRLDARFEGTDRQVDTYFNVREGRLKLRQGSIENSLIYYDRVDEDGPKRSEVTLVRLEPPTDGLRQVLSSALGVLVSVVKDREIYFIGRSKIHIDHLESFGFFTEIEVISRDRKVHESELRAECRRLMGHLDVSEEDLVARSYSDLLLAG